MLEAEYNIRQVKRFWKAATISIDEIDLKRINEEHDAIGALEIANEAMYGRCTKTTSSSNTDNN